jgi:hypothetical protein
LRIRGGSSSVLFHDLLDSKELTRSRMSSEVKIFDGIFVDFVRGFRTINSVFRTVKSHRFQISNMVSIKSWSF